MCTGNVWIYGTYGKLTNTPGEPTYCHPTLYGYAFWLMTAGYIVLGVVIFGSCVGACCALLCVAVCNKSSG